MSTARAEILDAVRRALAGADRERGVINRGYREGRPTTPPVELFVDRVEDYRAVVERCGVAAVEGRIAAALPLGARVVVPAGLPWDVPAGIVDAGFSAPDLDEFDAVVTGATVGIAETGTIVLTHDGTTGRRAISLVPDLHVCVVNESQIVASVPDALGLLAGGSVTTWISGPSATSDIELNRVEGVHGPRRLHVIVVDDSTGQG